jgi:protein SCO1/2
MPAINEAPLSQRHEPPAPAPINRTLQWTLLAALVLTIAGITAAFAFQQWKKSERHDFRALDRFKTVPAFELTERSGRAFDAGSELKGKIWFADFFFTTCPGPCLLMNKRMQELQEAVTRKTGDDVRLVSFTVFPQHDTPEVLSRYAERFHAQPGRWFFLTGEKSKIYDLANKTFLLSAVDAASDAEKTQSGDFVHSTKIALVDRQGVVRGYYDSASSEAVQHALTDLGNLLREQPGQAAAGSR